MNSALSIVKRSGVEEAFSTQKLNLSLKRAGAKKQDRLKIIEKIKAQLYPGISTRIIYRQAFSLLKHCGHYTAANYSLKQAILGLGPSGFYFEEYIARIFQILGYKTKVGVIKKGLCVKHEVDIVAEREDQTIYAECKFHNIGHKKNDIKTALYVQARAQDLKNNIDNHFHQYWLVSNTAFSLDAITYAKCSGLILHGLNTKEFGTLHDIIIRYQLYPVTSLRKIKKQTIQRLLENHLIMCKDLKRKKKQLRDLGFAPEEISTLISQTDILINGTLC